MNESAATINILAIVMAASGIVWGIIPLLIRPTELEWRAIVLTWLFGNQAVVTAVCAASRKVFYAASGSVTLVGAASMLTYGDSFSLVLAGLVLLSGVFAFSIFGAIHQSVNGAIEGRLTASSLAASLAEQQVELQSANANLAEQQVELQSANASLERLANRDDLTNLLNRRSFFEKILTDGGLLTKTGWLVYLDLDRFKDVNDTHGHAAGDALLQVAAKRWLAVLPPDSQLARTGGDEFAGWFTAASADEARAIATQLKQCLSAPVVVDGIVEIHTSCSIGLTPGRRDEPFLDAAARADQALYFAKANGRNNVEVNVDA